MAVCGEWSDEDLEAWSHQANEALLDGISPPIQRSKINGKSDLGGNDDKGNILNIKIHDSASTDGETGMSPLLNLGVSYFSTINVDDEDLGPIAAKILFRKHICTCSLGGNSK